LVLAKIIYICGMPSDKINCYIKLSVWENVMRKNDKPYPDGFILKAVEPVALDFCDFFGCKAPKFKDSWMRNSDEDLLGQCILHRDYLIKVECEICYAIDFLGAATFYFKSCHSLECELSFSFNVL
jgi:hypothetical protein